MSWKIIRLELAPTSEFPRGSAGRSYRIRLPLTDDGMIDLFKLEAEPARATARRFWPNQADMLGTIVQTPSGLFIQFESFGNNSPQLCKIDADNFRLGDKLVMTGPNGKKRKFRVASLH
jgi:hypothetical protein